MTPVTLILASIGLFVLAVILGVLNLHRTMKNPDGLFESPISMMLHILCGALASLASVGVTAGFLWFIISEVK